MCLVYPSIMRVEDTNTFKKDRRISWAVRPHFNLNIPGNWKTLKPVEEIKINYGVTKLLPVVSLSLTGVSILLTEVGTCMNESRGSSGY